MMVSLLNSSALGLKTFNLQRSERDLINQIRHIQNSEASKYADDLYDEGQVNLNAYDDLYGPDAQRRSYDPYGSAYGDQDRQGVPELEELMGASQQET